jgi:hypothetical protein
LQSREAEAIIIVKAAPQAGKVHGEVVCCAGLDAYGKWLRLYPVSFRSLDQSQKFGRWDRIKFNWRIPNDDPRQESRRVDQHTIEIVGELKQSEKERFLAKSIVTSLKREHAEGRSLALLKPDVREFVIQKKSPEDMEEERSSFDAMRALAANDLFKAGSIIPHSPCPYIFKYRYKTDDGNREGTCQDWEIEATFWRWSREYGEKDALERMQKRFGEEYPSKGMLLAMGTHRHWKHQWLINGVIRFDEIKQGTLL